MKKIILSLMFLITLTFLPASADDSSSDGSNWGIQPCPQESYQPGEAAEAVWENERDQYIYQNYGNDDSSAYLNRQNIDVYESNHGGDAFDISN